MLLTTGELRRSKGRFVLLTAGTGLLVFVLLFQQLLLDGVLRALTGALGRQSGEMVVFAAQAQRNAAGSLIPPQQFEQLRAMEGAADVAELGITMLAMQAPLDRSFVDVSLIGYRPGRAGEPTGLVEGRLPERVDEVVASQEDAFGRYEIGSQLTVDPGGSVVTVVGLTEGSRYNVAPTLWIPWDGYAANVQRANPTTVIVLPSVLAVILEPGVSPEAWSAAVSRAMPDFDAVTREVAVEGAPGLGAVRAAFALVMSLGYLVVGVVIGFFFLTLTVQKAPSITLLLAIGAPGKYLVQNLAVQVLVVALGGLVFGIVLLLAVAPFVRTGVPLVLDVGTIVRCAAIALGTGLAGAIPPARVMLGLDPFSVVSRPSLGGL